MKTMKLELQRHQLEVQITKRRNHHVRRRSGIQESRNNRYVEEETAVTRAHTSLEKLSWFEVGEVRGHVGEDGTVTEYQVVLKVAFQLKK
jgi:flavin-binding protein dodecin